MKGPGSRKRPGKRRTAVLDILIAHDNEIIRIGLRSLLKGHLGLRICGEASTAAETLKKVEKLQPHLLLVKLSLLDHSTLKIIGQLLKLRPGLRILLFAAEGPTMEARRAVLTPTIAKLALTEGALGLVLKPDAQDIRLALDALSKNKSFVSSNIFEGMADQLKQRTEHFPSVGELTAREVEVFKQMAIGKTSKEIASSLRNSPRTVEVQRANIMRKLGFHTQADLLLFALQHGVVELPEPVESL